MVKVRTVNMKLTNGLYMTIRKARLRSKELYLDERQISQHSASKVHVWTNGANCLFAFMSENEDCYYVPCLVEGKLKLEEKEKESKLSRLPSHYWFVKVDVGVTQHYSLKSLSEPEKYLVSYGQKVSTSNNGTRSLIVEEVPL